MSHWTEAEDEKLRKLWSDGVILREIGAVLGRSGSAVESRTCRLGLAARGSGNYRRSAIRKMTAADIGLWA